MTTTTIDAVWLDMNKVNEYTSREKIELTTVKITENEIYVSSATEVFVNLKKIDAVNVGEQHKADYEIYEEKFNALAFLWNSKVETGLFVGTKDDIHLQMVFFPLQSELESIKFQ